MVRETHRSALLDRADCTHPTLSMREGNEDEGFIARVPELAGCAADGTTYQEALANARVVIR
jgi:predicted RNase H-like HicB family nuclease